MDQELVSVIIPAYNSECYIAECIDSVLKQSHQNIEIIVVDDGSTDNTTGIISNYNCEKIKIYSQKNSGSAMARNLGVEKATGSWIAFLDSDDTWHTDKLQKQLTSCANHVWSHTDSYFIGNVYPDKTKASDLTEKHSGKVLTKVIEDNFIVTSSVMVTKEVFNEFGGFNSDYRALQDWDLWIRIASKYEIGYYDEPLLGYRVHSGSVSRSTRKTLPYHISLLKRVFSRDGVANEHHYLKKRALSRSCYICSQISEHEKDFLFSCYCSLRSLLYQPLDLSKYSRFAKLLVKTIIYYIPITKK